MNTDREQLIAKARAAIKPSDSIELVRAFEHLASENALGEATSTPSAGEHFHIWSDVPCKPGQCRMEPHTPSDDEREALATVIEGAWGDPTWDGVTLRPLDRQIADAVLAAGFRRTVQDEPSDDVRALLADADALVESWDRRGSWSADSPVGMVMQLARALRSGVVSVQGEPERATRTFDERHPACVEAWPDCHSMGYDPRCCRFPKSCSAGDIRVVAVQAPEGEERR